MKLTNKYFLKENFYFDIDQFNQFRIAGPGNHLLIGWVFPQNINIKISNYFLEHEQLEVEFETNTKNINTHCPLVCDIRTLRSITESLKPRPTYEQLIEKSHLNLLPEIKKIESDSKFNVVILKNSYIDIQQKSKEYGIKIIIPNNISVQLVDNCLILDSKAENIKFKVRTINNIYPESYYSSIFLPRPDFSGGLFSKFLLDIFQESSINIEHLIKNNKTSSFEYGTIFPRDWMESADLGFEDFTDETIDYMYERAMEFVSESGEGWHENYIGQSVYLRSAEEDTIDRKMIDIEPHYIMGLRFISSRFLINPSNVNKIKSIANFIYKNARDNDYITFKRIKNSDSYYKVGNWRDSLLAFPGQEPPVAPYDVNCIFYPLALEMIRDYNDLFSFDERELEEIIRRWSTHKEKYRIYHPNNILGHSLALYSKKNKPMPISHLDECYDLFYGKPSIHEVDSFARKITNDSYFYTPVGPLLVASDENDFSTFNYHGKVIWPKQSAYAVAGLTNQYKRGLSENWPIEILNQIKFAIIKTSQACFKGWDDLGFVPELYFYDEKTNKAKLYTDQEQYEAQMSNIQLWSSIAVRRIMIDYHYIQML